MSNWGWPQWVMMVLLIISGVQNVIIGVKDSQKTPEQLLLDAAKRKVDWQLRIGVGTTVLLFQLFILAKGGFWG